MKLELDRYHLRIIPQCSLDEAFLEEVFSAQNSGDRVVFKRVNYGTGGTTFRYLEACSYEDKSDDS